MKFSDLDLSDNTVERLEQQGITEPTTVQEKSIPAVFKGRDLLVESETGSGKTLAFSLPIIESVYGDDTQALILSPTRELAKQISEEIRNASDEEVVTIYGGVSYKPQIKGAETSSIVVGTPGRVLDLLKKGHLEVDNLNYFVLDEADRMLDMGFQDELESIISFLPDERQNLLFGATIPSDLKKMCDRYNIDPEVIRITESEHTRNLDEKYVNAQRDEKVSMLYSLLQDRDRELSIVFCKTKNTTRWLADKLRKNGIEAKALNGDMSQNKREKVVYNFEYGGEIKVIVATDVAARGIDIDDVTHVFNYDVPDTADTYTHRIGRAGRQGRKGEAVTLLEKKDHQKFRKIKQKLDIPRMEKDSIDMKDVRL